MKEETSALNLLEESFPGIKANIIRCQKLGFPWTFKTFLKEKNGEALSHVGFLEYPVQIGGKEHRGVALHAICTKNSHQGQGLASQLIQEALQWAKKYEFVILFTSIPKFYGRLSFQPIQEHRFHLTCKHPKGSKSLRPLISPQDNALLSSCFHNRAPLSNTLWVKEDGSITAFNTLFATYPTYWSLHYSEFFKGILSYEIKEKTLHLYDIISKALPPLDVILDHLPTDIEGIYFYFSPDQLATAATPEAYLYDNGYLLVYGNWPIVKPFMIPPLSRC